MILIDTNVASEPMKATPDQRVVSWLDSQIVDTLHLASVSLAEMLEGVELMSLGRRRLRIEELLQNMVVDLFHDRILPFDHEAASVFARRIAAAKKRGLAVTNADGQIAAIAAVHNLTVATRDINPFLAMGVAVINPWEA